MAISIESIRSTNTDEELMKLLSNELNERAKVRGAEIPDVVRWLATLPRGLRAMSVTHDLDVSMTFDDLGWHFANWHSKPYSEETERGLRELGAVEAAEVFAEAYQRVLGFWDVIGDLLTQESKAFIRWYRKSPLEAALVPLNDRMTAICQRSSKYGLLSYWLDYARQHPEKLL